jgi:hypothetical protein
MRIIALTTIFAALSIAPVLADDVPANLNGHWAIDGACDNADNSVHIEGNMLALGTGEPLAIVFYPDDSPSGNGAIHWEEEGSVDNFEYVPDSDELIYNPEGYGMGDAKPSLYKRCKS